MYEMLNFLGQLKVRITTQYINAESCIFLDWFLSNGEHKYLILSINPNSSNTEICKEVINGYVKIYNSITKEEK